MLGDIFDRHLSCAEARDVAKHLTSRRTVPSLPNKHLLAPNINSDELGKAWFQGEEGVMLLLGEVLHKGKTYIDVCGKISLFIRHDDEEREHSNPVNWVLRV